MADDKQPMQVSGDKDVADAETENPPSAGRPEMGGNPGPFGGGAYPNPHDDPDNADPQNTFMGHGGQSDVGGMGDGDEEPDEDE